MISWQLSSPAKTTYVSKLVHFTPSSSIRFTPSLFYNPTCFTHPSSGAFSCIAHRKLEQLRRSFALFVLRTLKTTYAYLPQNFDSSIVTGDGGLYNINYLNHVHYKKKKKDQVFKDFNNISILGFQYMKPN